MAPDGWSGWLNLFNAKLVVSEELLAGTKILEVGDGEDDV